MGTGTKEEQTIKQAASGRVPRRLAEQAMALQLAKLAIPILGKACKAVVKTILHPSEVRASLSMACIECACKSHVHVLTKSYELL